MAETYGHKYMIGVLGTAGVSVALWRIFFPWIGDDIKTIRSDKKLTKLMMNSVMNGKLLVDMFEETVTKQPERPCLIFEDRIYTYHFINYMANKVANLADTWNLNVGDSVAILISNEPAFVWTLLGLHKLGLATAFINHNLRSKSLTYSLLATEPKALIIGNDAELLEAIEEIISELNHLPIYVYGKEQSELPNGFKDLDKYLINTHPLPILKSKRSGVQVSTPMCYIFTSGTTGLPKPVVVNNAKGTMGAYIYQHVDLKADDVIYVALPLYHAAASVMALFSALNSGATVLLARKFSASRYFEDVHKYNVTIMLYIGEMCRYLLRNPKTPVETNHKIRAALGNGLRSDIWKKFQSRFKIPRIVEYFGASEGTGAFLNVCNKVGAVGRCSPLMDWFGQSATKIIKYDQMSEKPIRDKNGKCILVNPGEEGLAIARLPPAPLYSGLYKGLKDMNEKKLIRNVFEKGDVYFSFGDLVYLDKDYFVYFRDRIGDTFRWKGENVSTTEVANILCGLEFIEDASVYGVKVPGTDGQAGMAAIILTDNQDASSSILEKIQRHCNHHLPSYARPIFLRFMNEIKTTETMKHKKMVLMADGFDPDKISDPLFFMDPIGKSYIPLTKSSMQRVLTSKL